MKKKLFALTMCLLMVMCFMPTAAFANPGADNADAANQNTQLATPQNTEPIISGDTITVSPTNVQDVLDGKYGSINNKTIILSTGEYGVLYLRQSIIDNDTDETNKKGSTARTDLDYTESSTTYTAYYRALSNVTIKAADGATVTCDGIFVQAGKRTSSDSNPTISGNFMSYLSLTNVTIDGITFDGTDSAIKMDDKNPTYNNSSEEARKKVGSTILVDSLTIQNCTGSVQGSKVKSTSAEKGVHFFDASDSTCYSSDQYFPGTEKTAYNNITIDRCQITNYFQPVDWKDGKYTILNGLSVTNCTFTDCTDDHIHIYSKENKGTYVFTGNTIIKPIGKLFVIHNTGNGADITVKNNKIINPVAYSMSNYNPETGKNKLKSKSDTEYEYWRKSLGTVRGPQGTIDKTTGNVTAEAAIVSFTVNGVIYNTPETIDGKRAVQKEFNVDLYILPAYEVQAGEQFGKYQYTLPDGTTQTDVTTNGRGTDSEGNSIPPVFTLKTADKPVKIALVDNSEVATTYTAAAANTKFAIAADDTNTKKIDLISNGTSTESALKFAGSGTYIVNGVTYSGSEDSAYTITYATGGDSLAVTSGTVTVTLPASKSVKLPGKLGDTDVSGKSFTATNNNVSISVSTQNENTRIRVENGYTTEIKDGDTITGYNVTKYTYSGGGGSSSSSSSSTVVNTTESKTDTSASGETTTTTVPETKATVVAETKTAADGTKTTTATVDTTTAAKIVEKAVENKSDIVVVSAAATPVAETAAGTTTEVAIPAETISQISEKTEAAVTIESEAAKVTLDQQAVAAVAEQAGETGSVKLVVETVAQDASKVEVEIKLETSNGAVSDFKGGNVIVTVKLNSALAGKEVTCVYIDDNGNYHKVAGIKSADGTFTFITGHFSTYAIMSVEDADAAIAKQADSAKDLVKALSLKATSSKTKKGNIKVKLTVDADEIKAIEDLGYTVKYKFYRSTKKSASYKAKFETAGKTYTNTSGKKGTRYYYKARVMVYDSEGTLITYTTLKQCKYATRVR